MSFLLAFLIAGMDCFKTLGDPLTSGPEGFAIALDSTFKGNCHGESSAVAALHEYL
jgi:hypothetical protein